MTAEYVAMGSSFAAGPGLKPRVADSPRAAGRSTINYAHLLAARRGLDLVDVTFSGATTDDLLHASTSGAPAQLDAVTADTVLVTITCGGNDVGYLPGLTLSSLPRIAAPLVRTGRADAVAASTANARFATLDANLRELIRAVHRRAPVARVAVLDYLTILPPDGTPTGPLPAEVARWGRGIAERLSSVLEAIATSEEAVFVGAAAASREHHAWSAEPWTRRMHYSLRGGAPYHPNAAGMAALAALIDETLE